jgi:hypothetical protein
VDLEFSGKENGSDESRQGICVLGVVVVCTSFLAKDMFYQKVVKRKHHRWATNIMQGNSSILSYLFLASVTQGSFLSHQQRH